MASPLISIVVCTYNRCDLLKACLESLTNQTSSKQLFEIIIIDNNSTDKTPLIVSEFISNYDFVSSYLELEQGLSKARNLGIKKAKANWIGYLDDDATVPTDFIATVLSTLEQNCFDAFGGCYQPWFKYGKPKWFPEHFEKNCLEGDYIGPLKEGYNIWGAAMFFKKSVLIDLGGFPVHLGMIGNKIAYGEESYIISLMQQMNLKLGINSNIKIRHFVGEHKLKVLWHLKSAFAHGRDIILIDTTEQPLIFLAGLPLLLIKSFLKKAIKLLVVRNYYFQTFILEISLLFSLNLGKISGYLKKSTIVSKMLTTNMKLLRKK